MWLPGPPRPRLLGAAGRASARGAIALTIDPAIALFDSRLHGATVCRGRCPQAARPPPVRRNFRRLWNTAVCGRPALGSCRAVARGGRGCGLLFDGSRTTAARVGVVLLLAYAAAIAVNLRRGRRDLACGCGGPDDRRPIAGWMVWRNICIAILLAVAMCPWSPRPLVPTDAVTIGFGAATCALVYLCFDRLLGRSGRVTDELRIHR